MRLVRSSCLSPPCQLSWPNLVTKLLTEESIGLRWKCTHWPLPFIFGKRLNSMTKNFSPPLFQNGFIWQTFLPYFVLILLNVSHGRIYVSDSQVLHSTIRRNDFHFHNSEFCICFWVIFFVISCLLEWFEFSQIEKAYQCITLWYI